MFDDGFLVIGENLLTKILFLKCKHGNESLLDENFRLYNSLCIILGPYTCTVRNEDIDYWYNNFIIKSMSQLNEPGTHKICVAL